MNIFAGTLLSALLCIFGTGEAASANPSPRANVFRIYVAAGAGDLSGGLSPDQAVGTLGRALQIYDTQCNGRTTEILIAQGTYRNEVNTLKRAPCPLRISSRKNGAQPRFTGGGNGTWLNLSLPGVKMIDLTIAGLDIHDYQTAISINGDRNQAEAWIGGVRILKNRFNRIGSFREDQRPSTAAIRLVNTRRSVIEGNEFNTIRNFKACGGLHSIYMAHTSSDNVIKDNLFIDGCGDPIKVRDASNNNHIVGNRFERQEGNSLLLDSYCDKNIRDDCTKPAGECPSWDTRFEENVVSGPRPASNKKVVNARSIESALPNCPLPPSTRSRIREHRTITR